MVVRAKRAAKPTKEQLHRLVDELPDVELHTAKRYLEYLRNMGSDPFLRALMEAPLDDEPESPEEAAAVREAREQYARGEAVSDEEVWKRLGHGVAHRVGARRGS